MWPCISGLRTGPQRVLGPAAGQGQTKGGPCVRPELKYPLSDNKELQVVEEGCQDATQHMCADLHEGTVEKRGMAPAAPHSDYSLLGIFS